MTAAHACACCGAPAGYAGLRCLRCLRCGQRRAAPGSIRLQRTWAYLIASVVAYIPANLLPMMSTTQALAETSHTLIGGIAELWSAGSWGLALIVFVASIAVPLMKIAAIGLLAWSVRHAPHWRQLERTRLYRLVDAVGHWSMLDVYIVVLVAAMVRFGSVASARPEPGLLAFTAVVILTLLAAQSFDPRLIWQPGERDG